MNKLPELRVCGVNTAYDRSMSKLLICLVLDVAWKNKLASVLLPHAYATSMNRAVRGCYSMCEWCFWDEHRLFLIRNKWSTIFFLLSFMYFELKSLFSSYFRLHRERNSSSWFKEGKCFCLFSKTLINDRYGQKLQSVLGRCKLNFLVW